MKLTIKQPFSYYGGKQRIAKHILPLIPDSKIYVEPFAGGASIFWRKKFSKDQITILNDIDSHIYNFYKQMRDNPKKLCSQIKYTTHSERLYNEARFRKPRNDIERALYFFININQSFSNILHGGWGRSKTKNEALEYSRRVSQFPYFLDKLKDTSLTCEDAIISLKRWDSDETFFYIDPPYIGTDQGDFSPFDAKNFGELLSVLKKLKGSFILSTYENDFLKKLPWERREIKSFCSAMGGGLMKNNNTNRVELIFRKLNKNHKKEMRKEKAEREANG